MSTFLNNLGLFALRLVTGSLVSFFAAREMANRSDIIFKTLEFFSIGASDIVKVFIGCLILVLGVMIIIGFWTRIVALLLLVLLAIGGYCWQPQASQLNFQIEALYGVLFFYLLLVGGGRWAVTRRKPDAKGQSVLESEQAIRSSDSRTSTTKEESEVKEDDNSSWTPHVEARQDEPVVEEKQDEPVVDDKDKDSEPVLETKQDESMVEEKQDEPVVEKKWDEPLVEEKKDEPVVEEKQDEPVVEEKQDEPWVREKESEPVSADKDDELLTEDKEDKPVIEERDTLDKEKDPKPEGREEKLKDSDDDEEKDERPRRF